MLRRTLPVVSSMATTLLCAEFLALASTNTSDGCGQVFVGPNVALSVRLSSMSGVTFRVAGPDDAGAVAALHADSWRTHYRGAYADAFLDGDVVTDRNAVWTQRLSKGDPATQTQLAEEGGELVGFVHTALDADPTWGALLDNLHVLTTRHRQGIGAALLARSAAFVMSTSPGSGLYLWVLEQNVRAQRFYEAQGGQRADSKPVPDPGGVPGRINGTPRCVRYVWREPT